MQPGPVVTRFELKPAPGVKVSQISALAKDLARALSAISVRVVEVIPGKAVVGLEIPNESRELVTLGEILRSRAYDELDSPLALALGKDIGGNPVVADLAKMPHLLIAGTTGSGKSVAINAMVLSLLYKSSAEHVRLILIDPKMLELSVYEGIPHLLAPVVTDMKHAANALRWCVAEMERRYHLMKELGVRNLAGFNRKVRDAQDAGQPIPDPLIARLRATGKFDGEVPALQPLPFIVVVIDELADLMLIVGKKVEELIARLAQKARASGIHLVLATQRPSVDVITGLIKANIPARIAFQVSAKVDSRTILDQNGAESLLGHGDMLYLPPGTSTPDRVHGAFVSDREVHAVVNSLKGGSAPVYVEEVLTGPQESIPGLPDEPGEGGSGEGGADGEQDPAVRRGRAYRHRIAPRLGFGRAAPAQDRLQPRGPPGRIHGSRGPRRSAAVERQPRSARAAAAGILMRRSRSSLASRRSLPCAATADAPRDARAAARLTRRCRASTSLARRIPADGHRCATAQLTESAEGTVALARPGKFPLGLPRRRAQLIVSDGTTVWLYDADLAQVTVRPAAETLVGTPALLLSGAGRSARPNSRSPTAARTTGLAWSRARAEGRRWRFPGAARRHRGRRIAPHDRCVDRLGQTTRLDFDRIERNPRSIRQRFSFTPPPGVDVIGRAPCGRRLNELQRCAASGSRRSSCSSSRSSPRASSPGPVIPTKSFSDKIGALSRLFCARAARLRHRGARTAVADDAAMLPARARRSRSPRRS